jgi:hypothetical protein
MSHDYFLAISAANFGLHANIGIKVGNMTEGGRGT